MAMAEQLENKREGPSRSRPHMDDLGFDGGDQDGVSSPMAGHGKPSSWKSGKEGRGDKGQRDVPTPWVFLKLEEWAKVTPMHVPSMVCIIESTPCLVQVVQSTKTKCKASSTMQLTKVGELPRKAKLVPNQVEHKKAKGNDAGQERLRMAMACNHKRKPIVRCLDGDHDVAARPRWDKASWEDAWALRLLKDGYPARAEEDHNEGTSTLGGGECHAQKFFHAAGYALRTRHLDPLFVSLESERF
ncbi:hypothetical protein AMTR_s00008p00253750 [Amborella trichopoda]|uniref:Uncharacterized protein n=1 Tax=Amborella trichopoda TaxID=13333 RepID=W1NJT7_AMBTC|nr:hypothetical protein AMTR_s00008p00253750 [Amborella trichopoda]